MKISKDLISKLVKVTNDKPVKKSESTLYGTIRSYDNGLYVQFDGADILTPVTTTADISDGERVMVLLKDHTATVLGNITSPSPSPAVVETLVTDVDDIKRNGVGGIANERLNQLDADLDILAGDLNTLRTDLTGLNTDVGNVTDVLSSLILDIGDLSGDLSSLNTDIKAVNRELDNLASDVDALKLGWTNPDTLPELSTAEWNKAYDILATWASDINADTITMDGGMLTAGSVVAEKIGVGAITAAKIKAGAVTADKIEAGAITTVKIGAEAVIAEKIQAGAITTEKLGVKSVTAEKIGVGAIVAEKIGVGAVTADKIEAGAITAEKIGTEAITAEKIGAGAITAEKIGAGAITADKLGAKAITGKEITGGSIVGSTFTSANEEFMVREDGTVDASSLNIDEEISVDSLTVNKINNGKYQAVLDDDVSITINPAVTANSEEFEDESVYQSMKDFLEECPRNLNGYTVTINLAGHLIENVKIDCLRSGTIRMNFNGFTIYGYIYINGINYYLYGNKYGSTGGTTMGAIMPNVGNSQTGGSYSLVIHASHGFLYDINIYGGKSTTEDNIGVRVANWADGYFSNVNFIECFNAIKAYNMGKAYVSSSHGKTTNYAFRAHHGGEIVLNNTTQCGRANSTAHTSVSNNGRIVSDGVTWDSTGVTSSNTNDYVITATKTATETSNYGDTYRTTKYYNWKRDGTVRQGNYGYGNCEGCWFFGTKLSKYKDKNISKVTIKITRKAGGSSSAITHTLRLHKYSSRPSGNPAYTSGFSKTFALSIGESKTITLSTSAEITAFKESKGFGLAPTSSADQNSSHYSVCSGSATVKITYTE